MINTDKKILLKSSLLYIRNSCERNRRYEGDMEPTFQDLKETIGTIGETAFAHG